MVKPCFSSNARMIPTEVKDLALVERRRRQIVDAAVKLFVAKGFHKTTTREIARASGFSIGTLYEYVKTKEDVLYLVCEAIHQEMEMRIKSRLRATGGAKALLVEAVEAYFRVCDQMSDHILLIYQETKSLPHESMLFVLEHDESITEIFAEIIGKGREDGSLRTLGDDEVALAAHNIVVLGHMWTFRRWSLIKRFTLDQYINLQSALILGELT